MEIEKKLKQFYKLEKLSSLSKTRVYQIRKPAHTFTDYLKESEDGEKCFLITIRDPDVKNIETCFRILTAPEKEAVKTEIIMIFEGSNWKATILIASQ